MQQCFDVTLTEERVLHFDNLRRKYRPFHLFCGAQLTKSNFKHFYLIFFAFFTFSHFTHPKTKIMYYNYSQALVPYYVQPNIATNARLTPVVISNVNSNISIEIGSDSFSWLPPTRLIPRFFLAHGNPKRFILHVIFLSFFLSVL